MRTILKTGLLLAALATLPGAAPVRDEPDLVELYTDLHRTPELSGKEARTAARLARLLRAQGFTVTEKVGGHGVVAVLANGPGPVLLLRADMDALPVREQTGLAYASTVTTTDASGQSVPVMHACGHDMHMTVLIGTARRLMAERASWSGTLVLVAQPAEETGSGARAMLADGLYQRFPKPTHALALHANAALPAGSVGVAPGPALANVDSVDVTVRGVGGHGAYPHLTRDPVVLASQIVLALQTLVSRSTDPQEPAVVTVGSIHGGAKHNIVPDEVRLQLTVRSYTDATREALLAGIARIAKGQALAAGLPEDRLPVVTVRDEYTPATINSETLATTVARVATGVLGPDAVHRTQPVMGGEDFGRYGRADPAIQSTLFWLGAVKADRWSAAMANGQALPSLHSPLFAPDPEPTIRTGVDVMTAVALDILRKGA